MQFLESVTGKRIAVNSISCIDEFRPDKGEIHYTVHYHEGRDWTWVHPEVMAEFFESEEAA